MEPSVYVGVDVSKDRLDVYVRPSGECFSVDQSPQGIDQLVLRLRALPVVMVALEATGGYERAAAAALSVAGLPLVVVNPAQVGSFAKALGQQAKTDRIDAQVIARFVEATRPQVRPLPDDSTAALADLIARRRQIVDMISVEKQRLPLSAKPVQKSIRRVIKALERELAGVNGDIDAMIRASPVWRYKEDLLTSAPASARPSRAPCWPNCPNWAGSTVNRSPRWPDLRPMRDSPANGAANASSAAAEKPCGKSSSSAP